MFQIQYKKKKKNSEKKSYSDSLSGCKEKNFNLRDHDRFSRKKNILTLLQACLNFYKMDP